LVRHSWDGVDQAHQLAAQGTRAGLLLGQWLKGLLNRWLGGVRVAQQVSNPLQGPALAGTEKAEISDFNKAFG
jgi:hypothetical protein